MVRVAYIDSGLGLVTYADALSRRLPVELVLAMDPEHRPYGRLSPQRLVERTLAQADAALALEAQAIVVACNTASVHALDHLRAHVEVPVIGTVPAVRSAARLDRPFAIWATEATTGSAYQHRLIAEFAPTVPVHQIACPGLAQSIDSGDEAGIDAAIAAAAAATPLEIAGIVLGCTHYGLVAERITAAVAPGPPLLDSPEPVARQTVRRLAEAGLISPAEAQQALDDDPLPLDSRLAGVLASGSAAELPAVLDQYPAGRRLQALEPAG